MNPTPNVPKQPKKKVPSFVLPAAIGLVGFTALGLLWVQLGNGGSTPTSQLLPLPESPAYLDPMRESPEKEADRNEAVQRTAARPRISRAPINTPVRVLEEVRPAYPRMAKLVRVQGPVEVALKVDEQGHPTEVVAVNGNALLNAEALKAAKSWRFQPALRNGRAIASDFRIRFEFRLT